MKKIGNSVADKTRSFSIEPMLNLNSRSVSKNIIRKLWGGIRNPVNECVWDYLKVCTAVQRKIIYEKN